MTIDSKHNIKLGNGSRVAVIGGGPAGSFFSSFLLEFAERQELNVNVDIYDDKDVSKCGPAGCNHCGGIVSESLVNALGMVDGVKISEEVMQKGIGSYTLHTDLGNVKIEIYLEEQKIAAIYRGAGPKGAEDQKIGSFDKFLQERSIKKGANLIKDRVVSISFKAGKPLIKTKGGLSGTYDLLVGAVGVRDSALDLFENLKTGYIRPETTKTFILEYSLGSEKVRKYFGNSMHVFLLNIPLFEFAALIPKGNYVTLALLGKEINDELIDSLLNTPQVKECFPPDFELTKKQSACRCRPEISIKSAVKPYADRLVLVGDSATTKLYKNGINAAYDTARAAAKTAIFEGISNDDFHRHYWPKCQKIIRDNKFGSVVFAATHIIKKIQFVRRGVLRMAYGERQKHRTNQRMNMVLWDTFTGRADYKDIFLRALHPFFVARLLWETIMGFFSFNMNKNNEVTDSSTNSLGRSYKDGQTIVTQGEIGDCMYEIQSGKVKVVHIRETGEEVEVNELGKGDPIGEMALIAPDYKTRSATVISVGKSKILTIDKKTLTSEIQKDPSTAFRIMEKECCRIRKLTDEVNRLRTSNHTNMDNLSNKPSTHQHISIALCDTFTGSSNYKQTLHPFSLARLLWKITVRFFSFRITENNVVIGPTTNSVVRFYKDGQTIVTQGKTGDCMYEIQSGKVKVVQLRNGKELWFRELNKGDFFGEMALIDPDYNVRSATVISVGESRILAIDKKTLIYNIQKDPFEAFKIMKTLCYRIRKLTEEVSRLKASDRRDWDSQPDNK